MKEIDLPLTQTYSLTIDLRALGTVDSSGLIPLGTVVDPEKQKTTEIARRNGGKVLYATTSIEQQLEKILLLYFMGPLTKPNDRRDIFEQEILQSSTLSFSAKKELACKIINLENLLQGKKKSRLQAHLRNIMEWRNAFAHGKIKHDSMHGCTLNYYSGSHKSVELTDEFLDMLISTFKEANSFLKSALDSLNAKNA